MRTPDSRKTSCASLVTPVTEIVQRGCLALADISGYTAYLAGVELEHSHDILADLLGMVADGLCPPLRLAKLEGDAAFCFSPQREPIDGGALLGALQSTYLAFARRRRTVALSSSCDCDACRRTPELDLKFCVHYGSFVEHDVAGNRELVGSDVILAHRLLKNTVTETDGLRGYALVTDACADALRVSGLVPHVERYDDVGEVGCGLLDLEARWQAEQATGRDVIAREDADLLFEADIGAQQQQVWNAMTDPAHGMRWRVGVDDIQERNPSSGRGVGTVTHCVHGRTTIEQEIVDWLPPHHYTFREKNPAGACVWTVSLAPLDDGARTHIEWRIALRGGRRQAMLMRVLGGRVRKVLRQNFDALLAHVRTTTVA
jgi:carbon monoxide dehydrogenase subunit G